MRKSPIRHKVSEHTRKGKRVRTYIRGKNKANRVTTKKKLQPVSYRVGDFIEDAFAEGIHDPDFYRWASEEFGMTVTKSVEKTLDHLARKYSVTKKDVMDYLMEEQ